MNDISVYIDIHGERHIIREITQDALPEELWDEYLEPADYDVGDCVTLTFELTEEGRKPFDEWLKSLDGEAQRLWIDYPDEPGVSYSAYGPGGKTLRTFNN